MISLRAPLASQPLPRLLRKWGTSRTSGAAAEGEERAPRRRWVRKCSLALSFVPLDGNGSGGGVAEERPRKRDAVRAARQEEEEGLGRVRTQRYTGIAGSWYLVPSHS